MRVRTPAELAIYNAMQEVEKMPPDVRLTLAVTRLQEAMNFVSDFMENIPLKNQAVTEQNDVIELIPVDDTDNFPKDDEFYVLFDNGEVTKFYGDEHPFAIATHYFRPVVKKANLSQVVPVECYVVSSFEECDIVATTSHGQIWLKKTTITTK